MSSMRCGARPSSTTRRAALRAAGVPTPRAGASTCLTVVVTDSRRARCSTRPSARHGRAKARHQRQPAGRPSDGGCCGCASRWSAAENGDAKRITWSPQLQHIGLAASPTPPATAPPPQRSRAEPRPQPAAGGLRPRRRPRRCRHSQSTPTGARGAVRDGVHPAPPVPAAGGTGRGGSVGIIRRARGGPHGGEWHVKELSADLGGSPCPAAGGVGGARAAHARTWDHARRRRRTLMELVAARRGTGPS